MIDALLNRFEARGPDARGFTLANRVLLLKTRGGVDIESIVRRQGTRLEVERIRRWGRELAELKEDPDLLRPFEDVLRAARGPG